MRRVTRREASKLRRGCDGKRRLTAAEATAAVYSLRRRDGAFMISYLCPACRTFHVGHATRATRQSIRDRAA